jgi:hypothetical protein
MATGTMTPPVLQGPTAKEKKYDRQLRLWAASGQAALEDAHLLLINSGPGVIGVETLKNLVLPGKSFVADGAVGFDIDVGGEQVLDSTPFSMLLPCKKRIWVSTSSLTKIAWGSRERNRRAGTYRSSIRMSKVTSSLRSV